MCNKDVSFGSCLWRVVCLTVEMIGTAINFWKQNSSKLNIAIMCSCEETWLETRYDGNPLKGSGVLL